MPNQRTSKADRNAYMREWFQTPAGRERVERRRKTRATWREKNPELALLGYRKKRLRERYGMTVEDYERMFELQDGRCAICGIEGEPIATASRYGMLHVDHDHRTGAVRELLCRACNQAVGVVDEEPGRAEAVAAYIRKWREQ